MGCLSLSLAPNKSTTLNGLSSSCSDRCSNETSQAGFRGVRHSTAARCEQAAAAALRVILGASGQGVRTQSRLFALETPLKPHAVVLSLRGDFGTLSEVDTVSIWYVHFKWTEQTKYVPSGLWERLTPLIHDARQKQLACLQEKK